MHGKIDHHLQIRDQQDSSLTRYAEFRWGVCAQRAKHGRQCGNERTEQHGTRLRGGLSGIQRNPEGRRVRRVSTREIKGIDGNVQLNRAL